MRITSLHLKLIIVLVLAIGIPGGSLGAMQLVGRVANGPCFDIVSANGYAYAAQGGEVRVYDVSTPAKVSALSWSAYGSRFYQGDAIRRLAIDGTYLYIDDEFHLAIADISDPLHPVILSVIPNGGSDSSRGIAVSGNYAYLSVYGVGLRVVDVSSKSSPQVVKTLSSGTKYPWRSTISGNYLYVTSGNPYGGVSSRLDIFDITDPAAPVLKGTYTGGSQGFSGVAVRGTYAYVTSYYSGASVIDVSNPASPTLVSSISGINANDIRISGSYAYVSTRYEGFRIYDISTPTTMTLVGTGTGISGYTEGVFPTPTYTFLAMESMGFGIWDTTKVTSPAQKAHVLSIGGVDSLISNGQYLYLGGHNEGIWVIDLKIPSSPTEVAFVSDGGRNYDLSIQGSNLYAAADWDGLCIFDITSPAAPARVVTDFGNDLMYALGDGNYVYTGGSNSLFTGGIVDVTQRSSPKLVSTSSYMKGKFAKYGAAVLLVADEYGSGGLHILDVSVKTSPTLLANYQGGSGFTGVDVVGNTAVATKGNSIVTLDLTDPRNPRLLGTLSLSGWSAYALKADGNIVYAAGYGANPVRAFDISNPSAIRQVDAVALPYYSEDPYYGLYVDSSYVYAGTKWGAFIMTKAVATPAPVPTATTTPTSTPTPAPVPTATTTPTPTPAPAPTTTQSPSPTQPPVICIGSCITPTSTPTPSPDRAPVLAAIGAKSVNEGQALVFAVSASDPDGDTLAYAATSLPPGASFSAGSRSFSWTPDYHRAGTYQVSFSVSDGQLADSELVTITVNNVNLPPTHPHLGPRSVQAGSTLTFSLSATDPDDDPLTCSAGNMPQGAFLSADTGTFSWTPTAAQVGTYPVTFSISDGALTDTETVLITVEAATSPTESPTPTPTATQVPTLPVTQAPVPQPAQTVSPPSSRSPSPPGAPDTGPPDGISQRSGPKDSRLQDTSRHLSGQKGNERTTPPGSGGQSPAPSSSRGLANSGTGTGIPGDGSQKTRRQPPSLPAESLPPLGLHSVLVFGGTVTTTQVIRRFGSRSDFDDLIGILIKGTGVFTAGIVVWLVTSIL